MKRYFFTCSWFLFAQDGNAENGKKLFPKVRLLRMPRLPGPERRRRREARPAPLSSHLIAYVRHPSGSMPPYTGKVASDAELADIRAYLASVPAPPAAEEHSSVESVAGAL